MSKPLEDRVEAVLHWVRLLPVTPMRDQTVDLIQELLALTFRLERERDDVMDETWQR